MLRCKCWGHVPRFISSKLTDKSETMAAPAPISFSPPREEGGMGGKGGGAGAAGQAGAGAEVL